MKNILKVDFRKFSLRQQTGRLLSLSLDAGRLEGVCLRRTNGSVVILKSFSAALSLDPLTNDPELVGREIRNRLDEAGIRERRCVVALPLKWILTTHTEVPELSEADLETFLQTEAERTFPCDVATLITATSLYAVPGGKRYATLVGVPRNHVTLLERGLRAALLRPVSFSLGLTALQPAGGKEAPAILALAVGETHVGLQVTSGGGVAALRALEGTLETNGAQRHLHADVVARETRITLGQMPAELRQNIRHVRIFGPADLAQQLADELELRLELLHLDCEVVTAYGTGELGVHTATDVPVTAAFSLAARTLAEQPSAFEFLPPTVSKWQELTTKYSSGKLQQAGIAAAAVLLIVAGAFAFQQFQLMRLQSQWASMKTRVGELRDLQKKSAQFRPWYDDSFRSLSILKRVTLAFPEDGSVTAKLLEIRDPGIVTCTGVARDNTAYLKTVERLRSAPEIAFVNLGQTRGVSPALQFTFIFKWNEGVKSGN